MRKAFVFIILIILVACTTKPVTPTQVPTKSSVPKTSIPPTIAPTAIPDPGEYIVIAQLNFWYYGPGPGRGFSDDSGQFTTPFVPALGYYFASDPDVVKQQIDWAADYGVDAFSIEWTTPRGIGCCGSMEDTLDDVFLKAPNLDRTRWVIFYDLVLRILQTPGLNVDLSRGMDFDNPDVYNTFVADFDHFARKYFKEPHYLSIDGRPVVYIWGTWNAIGRFPEAFQEARRKVADLGYDVYIVGDIIRADAFDATLASVYDANTNFTFLMPGVGPLKDVGQAAVVQGDVYKKWQSNIQGLKVAGRQENVILQPGWAPQYDDRLFKAPQGQEGIYVPAMSKDQVVAMAEVARKYAQPAGGQGWKLVWINTWNNWAEATTIEPTIDKGPKYPTGNYQFDFLEIVRAIFGAETFGFSAPAPTTTSIPSVPQDRAVVIDTDMASDDWMAILYLLQRTDVTVKAITVTGAGESHCATGVQHALGLVALAGYDKIPVACGRETPLQGNHAYPDGWRDAVDNLFGLTLPSGQNTASNGTAVELLKSVIQSSPDKVTLLTLGPLTNVAEALQNDPSLVDNIEMIYIMGGAVNTPGNVASSGSGIDNQAAEWNIYVDPYATNIVFKSGASVTLVSLDATNQLPLTADFYERLKANHKSPEATFVFDLYTKNHWLIEAGTIYFWDQLAAAILTDESLATYQNANLCVVETEGRESGWTKSSAGCPEIRFAASADRSRFEQIFLDILNGVSP